MRHLVIGTAGHIDHGKSALVRALTGIDPDRLKEEKVRGITIDLGFAHERYGDVTFAFVDVPGHERFVKNMLAGASGIDCVLLVVAADESVMPQTREHFEICRLLHVPDGVVAITKCDLVDAETLELVRLEARELVSGSFLEAAPLIAVSAQTGQGLGELRRALAAVGARLPRRDAGGPVRLPIDRSFSIKGFGTVVTGTLASGRIEPEMDLRLLPSRRAAKVRNLQVHGEKQPVAVAGQRVAINLAGVDVAEIDRGDALIQPDTVTATRRLDARVELLPAAAPLKHGSRIRFHQGTSEVIGRAALGWAAGEEAGGAAPLSALAPGGDAYLRVHLERPAVLARGDRFILRAYSPAVTIAGGVVLDPQPVRGRMRTGCGSSTTPPAIVTAGE